MQAKTRITAVRNGGWWIRQADQQEMLYRRRRKVHSGSRDLFEGKSKRSKAIPVTGRGGL
jgi:hypothetical protein